MEIDQSLILDEKPIDEELESELVTILRSELDALKLKANAGVSDTQSSMAKPNSQELSSTHSNPKEQGLDSGSLAEIASRDARVAALERACKAAVRDRELATTLAGRSLVSGAAAQLIKLWRDEFDVYEEDSLYKVASRDGRKLSQVVDEWLASDEYSHFCLPSSRGGCGSRDASRPSQLPNELTGAKNLGEAIVMKWREETASQSKNPTRPIGLRRQR